MNNSTGWPIAIMIEIDGCSCLCNATHFQTRSKPRSNLLFVMYKYSKPKKDYVQSTEFHGMMESFELEKTFKIISLFYKPNTAKTH